MLLPVKVIPPLTLTLHTTETSYDFRFQAPRFVTDPNGAVVETRYDDYGRALEIYLPECSGDPALQAEYGDTASPYYEKTSQRIDDCSGAADYAEGYVFYDGLGRKLQAQSQADAGTDYIIANQTYDRLGRVTRTGVPYTLSSGFGTYQAPNWGSGETLTEYDPLGRTTTITAPDDSETITYYLIDNNTSYGYATTNLFLTAVVDANGHARHLVNDEWGNLIRVREFEGTPGNHTLYAETEYAYDLRDNLLAVTDEAANVTTITYDALNRKVQMDDPDMGLWGYAYDPLSNLTGQVDAKDQFTCFYYDALNRVTATDYRDAAAGVCPGAPTGQDITYTYDDTSGGNNGIGRRTGMADQAGTVSWLYDARGRVSSQKRSFDTNYAALDNTAAGSNGDYELAYTYNAADWPLTVTYPNGETVTTAYTDRGLADSLSSSLGATFISDTAYNALAQMTARTGGGLTTNYTYYTAGQDNNRLKQIEVGSGLLDLTYTYDEVGNIGSITDDSTPANSQLASFGYDHLDRLTSASTSGGNLPTYSHSYSYDEVGNIEQKVLDSQTFDYQYNDANHPHAVTDVGANDDYSYDANGNMTQRIEDGVTYSQTWTVFNKLKRVVWAENGQPYTTTFLYDGDNNRLLKLEQLPSTLPGAQTAEITTLYIGGIYEKQFNTTADDLSGLQAMVNDPDGETLMASLASSTSDHAVLDITITPITLSNKADGLAYPLIGAQKPYINTSVFAFRAGSENAPPFIPPQAPLATAQTEVWDSQNDFLTQGIQTAATVGIDRYDSDGSLKLFSLDDTFSDNEFNLDRWQYSTAAHLSETNNRLERPSSDSIYEVRVVVKG